MPTNSALVACEVCGENKRMNALCKHCAAREKEKREEEKERQRFENNAKQNCCYCGKPAGKVYVRARRIKRDRYDGGTTEDTVYSADLTGGPGVLVVSKVEGAYLGYRNYYTIAHRECHRRHLQEKAKELQKRAAEL